MQTNQNRSRGLTMGSWIAWGMAAALLVASILAGLTVGGASAAVPAATIGFQAPVLKPLWDTLVSGLQLLGVLVFVSGLTLSILMFCIGLLLRHAAGLEQRVRLLETTLVEGAHLAQPSALPLQAHHAS